MQGLLANWVHSMQQLAAPKQDHNSQEQERYWILHAKEAGSYVSRLPDAVLTWRSLVKVPDENTPPPLVPPPPPEPPALPPLPPPVVSPCCSWLPAPGDCASWRKDDVLPSGRGPSLPKPPGGHARESSCAQMPACRLSPSAKSLDAFFVNASS